MIRKCQNTKTFQLNTMKVLEGLNFSAEKKNKVSFLTIKLCWLKDMTDAVVALKCNFVYGIFPELNNANKIYIFLGGHFNISLSEQLRV
jgi:hypothetical protein